VGGGGGGQGQRRQSADIKGDACSSTLNMSPDTWHSGRAHSTAVPSVQKSVECGAADIALYVRRLAPLTCTGGSSFNDYNAITRLQSDSGGGRLLISITP